MKSIGAWGTDTPNVKLEPLLHTRHLPHSCLLLSTAPFASTLLPLALNLSSLYATDVYLLCLFANVCLLPSRLFLFNNTMTIVDYSPTDAHPEIQDLADWLEDGQINMGWRVEISNLAQAAENEDSSFIYINKSISLCLETYKISEGPKVRISLLSHSLISHLYSCFVFHI
jgi:hypothetical protein